MTSSIGPSINSTAQTCHHQDGSSINLERVRAIRQSLIPITHPYKDPYGRILQLWKHHRVLIASVQEVNGSITVLPGEKIQNALQPHEGSADLLSRLEGDKLKKWHLAYFENKKTVSLWPYLQAAGKDKIIIAPKKTEIEKKLDSIEIKLNKIKGNIKYRKPSGRGELRAVLRELKGEIVKMKPTGVPFDHILEVKDAQQGLFKAIKALKDILYPGPEKIRPPLRPEDKIKAEKLLSRASISLDFTEKFLPRPFKGPSPHMAGFKEAVQQNALADSYNAGNPGKPIPQKGATGGSIGGVGNTVGIIEGLFDKVNDLEESIHYFHIPISDGKMPFSNEELGQILRELATGIFYHDTVPFFSLHFNSEGNMYPVIHPAYQNTLVGRVISFLDYFMKGFLNGAFFDEAFVQEWQRSKTQELEVLKHNCIDLHEYCQRELGPDHRYFSIRELLTKLETQNASIFEGLIAGTESSIFSDYSGFHSSFRIIAKQNSIKKAGNLFLLDGDFDVLYTIAPDPVYDSELRKYRSQHGQDPQGYSRLVLAYEAMCHQIKTVMPRLPLFRELFEQLKVINFFSYYFKTLKQAQKVPVLSERPSDSRHACPPLFPHLPIRKIRQVEVTLDYGKVMAEVPQDAKGEVLKYLSHEMGQEGIPERIVDIVFLGFRKQLQTLVPFPLSEDSASVGAYKEMIREFLLSLPRKTQEFIAEIEANLPQFTQAKKTLERNLVRTRDYGINLRDKRDERRGEVNGEKRLIVYLEQKIIGEQAKIDAKPVEGFLSGLRNKLILVAADDAKKEIPKIQERIRGRKKVVKKVERKAEEAERKFSEFEATQTQWKTQLQAIKEAELGLANPIEYCLTHYSIKFHASQSVIEFYAEQSPEERDRNKRIVGGCGLDLKNLRVSYDPEGEQRLDKAFPDLYTHGAERFVPVMANAGDEITGYIFQLPFGDFAVSKDKDYGWMPFLLARNTPVQYLINQARAAIDREDIVAFAEALNAIEGDTDFRTEDGRSLIHQAASARSAVFLKELIARKANLKMLDSNGYLPLHYAAKEGLVENVLLLLECCPATLNYRAHNGATPLYTAVQHRRQDVVRFFLQQRAHPNSATNQGMTPLYSAIHHGFEEIALELLMVDEVDVNLPLEDGTTPVYLAVESDLVNVVDALIKREADVNKPRRDSYAPLHICAKKGSKAMCLLLLQAPNIKINPKLKSGHSPLHLASEWNSSDVVALLLEKNATLAVCGWDRATVLMTALRSGNATAAETIISHYAQEREHSRTLKDMNPPFLDFPDITGETPLGLSLKMHYYGVLELLLENGATLPPPIDFLKMLCVAKVDPLYIRDYIQRHQFEAKDLAEACYLAAKQGHNQMVGLFRVIFGVKDFTDSNGWCLVHFAAKFDHIDEVQKFIRGKPADYSQITREGKSIAAIAAEYGSCRVLKLMLDAMVGQGISLRHQFQGNHLLMAAMIGGNRQAIDLIIRKILDPNIVLDNEGRTAAHFAAMQGDVEALELLRTRGAHFDIPDATNKTVFHYAFDYQCDDVIDYLLNKKYELIPPKNLLYFVSGRGYPKYIKKLIEIGYDVNITSSKTGATPLFKALRKGNYRAFVALCEGGGNIHHVLPSGVTLLHLAAGLGKPEFLSYLAPKVSINQTILTGQSALHHAVSSGCEVCVAYLLGQGIETSLQDIQGYTALDLANAIGYTNIAMLLQGQQAELKTLKRSIVSALKTGDIGAFFTQIAGLPLNLSMTFDIDGTKHTLPLLHLIYKVVYNREVRLGIFAIFKKLARVDINVCCPQKRNLFHLMAEAGEEINFEGVDPLRKDVDGISVLHLCAAKSSPEQLRLALKQCRNVDTTEKNGLTPLFAAIMAKKADNVGVLLEWDANPNHMSQNGISPLMMAIENDQAAIAKLLIEKEAKIDAALETSKRTPLMQTIAKGNFEIAWLLIIMGADPKKEDAYGVSAIHLAALQGNLKLLRLLHAAGASLKATDHAGNTVAHHAARSNTPEIIDYLGSHGISLQEPAKRKVVSIRKSGHSLKDLAPMHLAALKGNMPVVQKLLSRNCNPEVVSEGKLGVLFFAARSGTKSLLRLFKDYPMLNRTDQRIQAIKAALCIDSISQLKILCPKGLSAKLQLDEQGLSALDYAAMSGSLRCTHHLVERGGEGSFGLSPFEHAITNNQLATARYLAMQVDDEEGPNKALMASPYIHKACEAGHLEMVTLLIGWGTSINEVDVRGWTGLHVAASKGNYLLMHRLLALGADPEQVTVAGQKAEDLLPPEAHHLRSILSQYSHVRHELANGDSPLHIAVRLNDLSHIPLLAKIQDVDQQNLLGQSALHLAVQLRSLSGVRMLLEREASLELRDGEGRTPLFLAESETQDRHLAGFFLKIGRRQ